MDESPTAAIAAPVICPDLIFPAVLLSGPAVPSRSLCTSTAPFVLFSTALAHAEKTLPQGLCFGARVAMRMMDVGAALAGAAWATVSEHATANAPSEGRIMGAPGARDVPGSQRQKSRGSKA